MTENRQGKFFRRVFSRVGLLLAAGMTLVCLLTWEITQEWLRDYTVAHLLRSAHLAEWELSRRLAAASPGDLGDACREIEARAGLRVTIIDPSGAVLGDSQRDAHTMENHAQRPEVAAALRGEPGHDHRLSVSVGKPFVYVAVPMLRESRVVGVVRVAAPDADIHDRELTLVRWVATGLAVALPVAMLIAGWVSRTLSRPVQRVGTWAQRLATGDLETRLEVAGDDEVARVAESLERMRVNLSEQIRQARQQRQDLETTLGNLAEGVIVVNDQGVVLMANVAARGMLGLDGSLVNWPLTVGLGKGSLSSLWSEAVASDANRIHREVAIETGREKRNLDVHLIRVREQGTPIAWLLCVRDISERLRSAAMKADFVANASHELRTPVAAIRAAVETLRADGMDEATRTRFLLAIDRNVERLSNLTEDLMHLNRVESAAPDLHLERVTLDRVYSVLRPAFESTARERGVTLEFQSGDVAVFSDARWVELILKNLLDNAFKFTPRSGSVTVHADRTENDVIIEVRDTGCGIPAADLDRVFERFYQVDRSRGFGPGGSGLGLAIVKHAVLALGGQVEIASEVDRGTTVRVRLPADSAFLERRQ